MNENEEVLNRKEVSGNSEKSYEDSRRMITRTARFSVNEEAAVRKTIKTSNEELLVVKLEKGNNLRIFCSTTAFEGVKKIIENSQQNQQNRIYKNWRSRRVTHKWPPDGKVYIGTYTNSSTMGTRK